MDFSSGTNEGGLYHRNSTNLNAADCISPSNEILQQLLQQQFHLNQQQQQFRWHQQQFLGKDPDRKPSHDDLFEMASLLLDQPSQVPSQQSLASSTSLNVITPSNSIRGGVSSISTISSSVNMASKSGGGSADGSGLFDDAELEQVLLVETEDDPTGSRGVSSSIPQTKDHKAMLFADPFLPEKTLEEVLRPSNLKSKRKRSSHDPMWGGNNLMAEVPDEEYHDEWCLIDFGDDQDVPVDGDAGHGTTFKRQRSLQGFLEEHVVEGCNSDDDLAAGFSLS
jgi:hypothetical protein